MEGQDSVLNLESHAQAQLKYSKSLEGIQGQKPIYHVHFKKYFTSHSQAGPSWKVLLQVGVQVREMLNRIKLSSHLNMRVCFTDWRRGEPRKDTVISAGAHTVASKCSLLLF